MNDQPNWLTEAGVRYRTDTGRNPIERGETLLYYNRRYLPTGEEQTDFVVVDTSIYTSARRMLLELLNRWNSMCPSHWSYSA
jgi:hypothetical protein